VSITAGCFIGILLGEMIGLHIIANNWKEINKLISNGIHVSKETMNRAYIHQGVYFWLCIILISIGIGLVADMLYKRRLRLAHS